MSSKIEGHPYWRLGGPPIEVFRAVLKKELDKIYGEEEAKKVFPPPELMRVADEVLKDETCSVCGPPVKTWWPVHRTLCSNQNPLLNLRLTRR